MPDSARAYVDETRSWLRTNNDAYKAALEKLGDPSFVRKLFRSVEEGLRPILSYNPREEGPEVAVFACGAVQAKIERLLTDFDFIDEYEHQLDEVCKVEHEYEPSDSDDNPVETIGSEL